MKHRYLILLLSVFSVFFASCDSDDWFYQRDLEGVWRIVETSGPSPYQRNDHFEFAPNGSFYAWGRSLEEEGVWDVYDRRLCIDFDFDGYDDLVAPIRQLDHGYLHLDVHDYDYDIRYTLRLVRD